LSLAWPATSWMAGSLGKRKAGLAQVILYKTGRRDPQLQEY